MTARTPALLALAAVALLAGCEVAFDPIEASTRYYSLSGYLDTEADTQWVRVEPLDATVEPSSDPIDAVVTLVGPGGSARMAQRVVRPGPRVSHLFWTTADVAPGAVYTVVARRPDGAETRATVRTPAPDPPPTLSDGYDQLFQTDYAKTFGYAVESIAAAADYRPDIPLFLEYKFNETRVHCLMDTCDKTLLLIQAAKAAPGSLGVTIDFGHSIYANENPARALATCAELGIPYYLHTNDNDARFDWDLIGASRHFLHYAEFLFYAAEYGYDRYFTTDASPRVFDMRGFFERHDEVSRGLWQLVHTLDRGKYRRLMEQEDANELMRLVNHEIYRIAGSGSVG